MLLDVMTKADRELTPKLYRMAVGGDNPGEAENARVALVVLLKKYKYNWGDMTAIMIECDAADRIADEKKRREHSAKAASKNKNKKGAKYDALTAVHLLLQKYIDMQPHEYIGVALWIMHTHVHERFEHTPRLALTSSTPRCGKSNTIKALKLLARDPVAVSSISTAALFRTVSQGSTVIIDEADNAQLFTDMDKRGIINSGFDYTANVVSRYKETFDTRGPMAFGSIGRLPGAIMDRALHVHLYRSPKDYPVLNSNDEVARRAFQEVSELIYEWLDDGNVKLDPKPETPLRSRPADKWRVLLAIADSFGAEWGERARQAAIVFDSSEIDEAIQTVLLLDCETVFNLRHVDRIRSEELVSGVLDLDTRYPWTAYRGPKDDENITPRKLKQGDMARLLGMFNIRPKKIRFGTGPNQSFMGYERQQFEKHWNAYRRTNPQNPGTPELKLISGGKKK